MKKIKLVAWLSLFLGLIIPGPSWADGSQEMLVGHHEKEKYLVQKTEAIFVGQFVSLGNGPSTDEAGMGYYDGAQVKIDQSLKGSLSGTVTVSYSVMNTSSEKEINPHTNKDYIFFIHILSPTQLSVEKLLPATDANITRIKALIAAAPASK